MTGPATPERDLAAGEYVLGTLTEAEREAFERDLHEDVALQAAVYEWQDRLVPLSTRVPARTPSPLLWGRIEASVAAVSGSPDTLPDTRPDTRAAARPPAPRTPWWQRLGWWQGLSGMAVLATLVLSVLLLLQRPLPESAGARYLAVLQAPQGGATGWVVELQAGGQMRLLPAGEGAAAPVPPGRALQFWTKAEDAPGPTSLGLVQAGQPLVLPASRLPAVGQRQLFEITLEPEGGSPYDRPSGPILYVGRTIRL